MERIVDHFAGGGPDQLVGMVGMVRYGHGIIIRMRVRVGAVCTGGETKGQCWQDCICQFHAGVPFFSFLQASWRAMRLTLPQDSGSGKRAKPTLSKRIFVVSPLRMKTGTDKPHQQVHCERRRGKLLARGAAALDE